jgi:predicted enzyme related to lactoylglutathione lyase
MVVIAAAKFDASVAFYRAVFGWQLAAISDTLAVAALASGPIVTLRGDTPAGYQGVVPFISVTDVPVAMQEAIAAGATVERAPWHTPMTGTLARFTDPSSTIYGLSSMPDGHAATPHVPAPFGDAPRPPDSTVCSLEMYAGDLASQATFVRDLWGWSTRDTMPKYLMFDAGAGIGGVFQSHTPASRGVAYIYASDVRATLDAIDAAGGARMGEAMAMPGMATFGYFGDPSGTMLGLIGG